jgi:hypothetical protein
MKMPGKRPCLPRKRYLNLSVAVVLLIVAAVAFSGVVAEEIMVPACSDVDQFGNPVCPDIQAINHSFNSDQVNNTENAWDYTGITVISGKVKGMAPEVMKGGAEFLEIAGFGLKNSINQTRNAREYAASGNNVTGNGTGSTSNEEQPGMKGLILEFAEIAGFGMKNSINQTLHAGEYPDLAAAEQEVALDNLSEEEMEDIPPPNILRVTYGNSIKSVLQFLDVTSRAVKGSLRNNSANNTSARPTFPDVDLIGISLYGPVPEEKFLPKTEIPVTRINKNVSPNFSQLLTAIPAPAALLPVKPAPTPVPAPLFNLTVDSYPSGALIVLDGNRTGTTPYVMTGLEQKTYIMTLTRSGYLAYSEAVTLDTDKTLEIPLTSAMDALFVTPGKSTVQNKYGGMYITSFPDQLGLTIDGVAVPGGTPFLYYGFPEGLHTIQLLRTDKSGGPVTYTRSVWVYHDALTPFNVNTEEILTAKRISISPGPYSGAEFTINGKFPSGRLPATITAGCPGSFIGVRKGDAYTSFLIPCTNQDTITMTLSNNLEPHPPLQISSSPDGAEIFIDGFRTGYSTPHTFNEVSGGLHRIMVSKPGFYPKEEIVTAEIRDANTSAQKVFFAMENYGEGTIVIDSLPPGAAIFLNSWSPGEVTPHTFDHMKIGFYEVIVQMGSKPWIEQFELTPSKVSKVVADFEV